MDATAQRAKKARGETDLANGLRWMAEGNPLKGACPPLLVLGSDDLEGRSKVAGFDIDFTVIRTASGRKFATGNFVNEIERRSPPPPTPDSLCTQTIGSPTSVSVALLVVVTDRYIELTTPFWREKAPKHHGTFCFYSV